MTVHVLQDVINTGDICVLGIEIEEVGLVRLQVSITHRFAWNDNREVVLQAVHRSGADAAACGEPGNDK